MDKFIVIRDVRDRKNLISLDKIINIYEGKTATYIKCVEEEEIPTYETVEAIKLKIEELGYKNGRN